MKKREIIDLINNNMKIRDNDSIIAKVENREYIRPFRMREEDWFPDIPELNEYFEVLRNEIKETIDETDKAHKKIINAQCDHQVRLEHYGFITSDYECVLCGHHVSSDNSISFKDSNNRNKHTVTFIDKYQTDDYYDDKYEVKEGKTKEQVYAYILGILEKYNDEDEVDLVEEFSKLNIPNMTINKEKRKQEKYILIIAGTNKEYLNDYTYISNKYNLKVEDIYNKFISMLNTKVAIIDNSFKYDRLSGMVEVENYDTLDSLNEDINRLKDINFSIVIDLSKLYKFNIVDNNFISEEYNLPLNELFPNSNIFTIDNSLKLEDNCEEIRKLLKKK